MKRMMLFLLVLGWTFFHNVEINALPVAVKSLSIEEMESKKLKNRPVEKEVLVKELSKRQQNKLTKKSKKLKKKLKKKEVEFGSTDGIEDVFGERYFILGSIFFLGGLALAILGGILSVGLFGWLGGVGMVVGLVLVILAIIQVT